MTLPVAYLPQAHDDIRAAHLAYEQQQTGRGARFLDALRDRLDQIRATPALYGVLHRNVRAAPVRPFSYIVYYRVEAARILIIAVQHAKRGNRAWRGRI